MDKHRLNLERYFDSLESFKDKTLNEIKSVMMSKGRDLLWKVNELKKIAGKSFENDVKFVAFTLTKGVKGRSLDDDVMTLFELHAAKRILI